MKIKTFPTLYAITSSKDAMAGDVWNMDKGEGLLESIVFKTLR